MRQYNQPMFTIITVCFNEKENIQRTIESVLCQSYEDYEYILCDGGSSDGTLEIAKAYQNDFERKGIRYHIHSEKDGGIYFGMNIGVALSTGMYLNFMNAGDEFHNREVLAEISQHVQESAADILYGDIIKIERGYGKREIGNIQGIKEGMSFCHQAMFIKSELLRLHPYNTRYRIVADYEFTLSMWKQGKKFAHVNVIVANFRAGGISTTDVEKVTEEYCDVKAKANVAFDYQKNLKSAKSDFYKWKIKNNLPKAIWKPYNCVRARKNTIEKLGEKEIESWNFYK